MALAGQLENVKVIFVMGGPGSGKGTQCGHIVAKYGLTHLSSGDLLRSEVAMGSAEGKRLRRGMLAGELVPLHDVLRLLRDAMRAMAVDSPGFVINGYPRSVEQALRFETEVAPCQAVIALNVPEEVMKQRLLRRGREGDTEAVIAKKLDMYRRITKPALDYYAKKGKLINIDGSGSVDEVFHRVQNGLLTFSVRNRQKSGQGAAAAKGRGGLVGVKAGPAARHLAPAMAKHGAPPRHTSAPARDSRLSGKNAASAKWAPIHESMKSGPPQASQGQRGNKASAGSALVANRKPSTAVVVAGKGATPVGLRGVGTASVRNGRGAGAVKAAQRAQVSMTSFVATGRLQPSAKAAAPQKHLSTGKGLKASSRRPPLSKRQKTHRT